METVSRPEDLAGQPVPDLTLPDSEGRPFALRGFVGRSPLAVFLYIRNGTPG